MKAIINITTPAGKSLDGFPTYCAHETSYLHLEQRRAAAIERDAKLASDISTNLTEEQRANLSIPVRPRHHTRMLLKTILCQNKTPKPNAQSVEKELSKNS